MEQSPWETNRFLANLDIPRFLWNQNVRYRIYKSQTPVPNLSQLDPVHTPLPHPHRTSRKSDFNIKQCLCTLCYIGGAIRLVTLSLSSVNVSEVYTNVRCICVRVHW